MESNSLNSKHFKFNNEADFILYLAELITDLIQKKDRLERYGNEVKLILKNNPNAKFIQSDNFESINDKVNRINQYIFNIIGDESKKAVSYRKFRKFRPLHVSINPRTGPPHAAEASGHVFLKNKVLTNRQ